MLKTPIVFLAGLASVLAAPAFAGGGETIVSGRYVDETPVAYVSIKGIDLASDAGVAALRQRVNRAAKAVCISNGRQPIAIEAMERACKAEAVSRAEPQIAAAIGAFKTRDLASLRSLRIVL